MDGADAYCRRVERAGDAIDTITLDETDRHRRRFAFTSDGGIAFLFELERATLLRDGDVLRLDDGRGIVVRARPEPLHEVRGRDAHHLLCLAWHVGNRHLPAQFMSDHLRIRRDAVIARMLEGLGAELRDVEAGFDPEGGAYAGDGHTHAAGDGHTHTVEDEREHASGGDHARP